MPPRSPEKAEVQWLTTVPNPHARYYGTDDGQRGWVTHAVAAMAKTTFAEVRNSKPFAAGTWLGPGLVHREKCKRCQAAMARRNS